MKCYVFTIKTSGYGNTPEEAWANACETITTQLAEFLDPNDIPDYEIDPGGDVDDDGEDEEGIANEGMSWLQITEDEFDERYPLVENHLNPDAGCFFETYGSEWEFVRKQDPRTVWTVTDQDGETVIVSGFHHVNRLGYYVSTVPVPEGMDIEVVKSRED